ALITHCRSPVLPWKSAAIAASPTFTTDPSTKARLEARMQVAITQRGCGWVPVDWRTLLLMSMGSFYSFGRVPVCTNMQKLRLEVPGAASMKLLQRACL